MTATTYGFAINPAHGKVEMMKTVYAKERGELGARTVSSEWTGEIMKSHKAAAVESGNRNRNVVFA